jgi:proton-coupled amino acid transporter
MSSPLPVNAKQDRNPSDSASSHINESVLAGSFDRAESTARLGTSPIPSVHHFGTSPSDNSLHLHPNYGTNNGFLSVSRPQSLIGDNVSVDLPDEEVARAVKRHLVSTSPSASIQYFNKPPSHYHSDGEECESTRSVHQLPGGAITHDIYKWSEDQERKARSKRSKSVFVPRHELSDPALVKLRDPGGFRRHFVLDLAAKRGKKPPGWLTHTFVDFLALYGHFGGEDLSDDEGMSSDDEGMGSDDESMGSDEEDYLAGGSHERTALLRQARANSVEGTASPTKAVFLLLKSFIGTGTNYTLIIRVNFYSNCTSFRCHVFTKGVSSGMDLHIKGVRN